MHHKERRGKIKQYIPRSLKYEDSKQVQHFSRSCDHCAHPTMIRSVFVCLILTAAAFWAGTLVNVRGTPILSKVVLENNPDTHEFNNIGITGYRLLDFFERKAFANSALDNSDNVNVSRYYDEFMRYLAGHVTESQKETTCFPEGSIISKLTRDVNVITNVHSHNDYWRNLPMFEALCYGIASIEADVWLVNNNSELAVGHNRAFLNPLERSLNSLYTGPLLNMLNEVNCHQNERDHKYGVFYNSPETTLYLYIDFKSEDSKSTYELLINNYLKALIDMGYMTFLDIESREIVWNPVTIILTGDYPTDVRVLDGNNDDGIFHTGQRFVFVDAPLHQLKDEHASLSIVASASLSQLLEDCTSSEVTLDGLSPEELHCIKPFVEKAHSMKLKTRIWGVPTWPNKLKMRLWDQQANDLMIDFLNTDDLFEVSQVF
ncbi:LANO_0H04896g1_1 [Lachancea nothofagi CBS 11611]|uniref:Altered inheritance of mitochondria protein 6 n=1 Tax=Lachancea nothofagi CBS 11611 TaxID=1266666 RepID=A0A1G4KLG4_9SACH|nr:LANO_0H04896g1_1 [Lachancea nothofagi CBS 11611]